MRGTLDDARGFTLVGTLTYANEDGDEWVEHRLVFDDGREGWLEIDESEARLHREWSLDATLDPPTVGGERVAVGERGRMRLVRVEGDVPAREHSDGAEYVDGRLRGGALVSLERDARGVVPYRAFRARWDGRGRLTLAQADLDAWDALVGARRA